MIWPTGIPGGGKQRRIAKRHDLHFTEKKGAPQTTPLKNINREQSG
jgi:hypothetical protein